MKIPQNLIDELDAVRMIVRDDCVTLCGNECDVQIPRNEILEVIYYGKELQPRVWLTPTGFEQWDQSQVATYEFIRDGKAIKAIAINSTANVRAYAEPGTAIYDTWAKRLKAGAA